MSISSLSDQAQLILDQRLSVAANMRTTKQAYALHRAQKRFARAMASGLRKGLTIDGMINQLAGISQSRGLPQAK